MKLEVYDTYTKVSGMTFQDRQWLRLLLAARPEGYQFMPSYKSGKWDGYISLLKNSRFPSGLLDMVLEELYHNGETCVVDDRRVLPPVGPYEVIGYDLRDYQRTAVLAALDKRRGVLKMATNAGKTLVMACIIKATGCKAVVIVPTRALLMQTADRLSEMLGKKVGQYGAGQETNMDVTVTTIASLPKLIKTGLKENQTIICDETHHLRAATISDNIFSIPGPNRFGMSGTPLRTDVLSNLKLIGATGQVIVDVSNAELINDGWSVRPVVSFQVVEGERDDGLKYYDAYNRFIVDNQQRNEKVAAIAALEQERGPVLIVVDWIRHAKILHDMIAGSVLLTGSNSKEEIVNAMDEMRAGRLRILVATPIFGEGIDIPSISSIIMADAAKGHIRTLQRVGRGLRTKEGKDTLHVHDFIDDSNKYLLKHSQARYDIYKNEGFECDLLRDARTSAGDTVS